MSAVGGGSHVLYFFVKKFDFALRRSGGVSLDSFFCLRHRQVRKDIFPQEGKELLLLQCCSYPARK